MKAFVALGFIFCLSACAMGRATFETTADRVTRNPQEKILIFEGHAEIRQPHNSLFADRITLDPKTKILTATGNCIYQKDAAAVKAQKMSFHVVDETWVRQE